LLTINVAIVTFFVTQAIFSINFKYTNLRSINSGVYKRSNNSKTDGTHATAFI